MPTVTPPPPSGHREHAKSSLGGYGHTQRAQYRLHIRTRECRLVQLGVHFYHFSAPAMRLSRVALRYRFEECLCRLRCGSTGCELSTNRGDAGGDMYAQSTRGIIEDAESRKAEANQGTCASSFLVAGEAGTGRDATMVAPSSATMCINGDQAGLQASPSFNRQRIVSRLHAAHDPRA